MWALLFLGHREEVALDLTLPLQPLLGAEAGELEPLQCEQHPGEAVHDLRVATRVGVEHLGVESNSFGEALGMLEARCVLVALLGIVPGGGRESAATVT